MTHGGRVGPRPLRRGSRRIDLWPVWEAYAPTPARPEIRPRRPDPDPEAAMRRTLELCALVVLAAALAAVPARAQTGPFSVGAGAGVTAITGDFKDTFDRGWRAEGILALGLPLLPVSVRGELAYDQLPAKAAGAGAGALKVASGTLDGILSLPFPLLHPYVIGGVGYYVHNHAIGEKRGGAAGVNGGVGVELSLPGIKAFVEARYHTVSYGAGRLSLVPVTVGLVF